MISKDEINQIIQTYTVQYKSMSYIANEFHYNIKTIKEILLSNGVELRTLSQQHQKKFNHDYFKVIDTEEKAYWLGFIYADGCVTNDVFSVRLDVKDILHLEKLKKCMESDHSIGIYESRNGYNIGKKFCQFSIHDKQLVLDLIDKGVYYRKSNILTFPNNSIVPDNLISHFIRGYFDGDGSVYVANKKYGYLGISFDGDYEFLSSLLSILSAITGTNSSLYKSSGDNHYSLKIGGTNQVKRFAQYLYSESSIFLERKRNTFTNNLI